MSWKEIPVQDLNIAEVSILIDVREPDEYTEGHIPGAVNVPLSVLESSLSKIPSTEVVYMVCRSGARSARACDFLVQQPSHSSTEFVNVGGGTMGWIVEGREVVTGDNPR
jgi:rhodanese-related sulfurtransferase